MYYRHDLDYKYPERSDEHMIDVKHLRDTNFDENYNYLDETPFNKFKRGVLFALLNTVVFPVVTIRHGLKIHDKENYKKHKAAYKDGAITICNHVFMWDYLCVLKAIRPHMQYFPAWQTNFEGPNGPLIRWVGGMPVPTHNFRALAKFNRALNKGLADGKWIHFFPEGSMWFYYPDIRPLKKAVFQFAVAHNKPIIPMAITFRERKGISRLFSKNPCADLHIGELLFPDQSLPPKEATDLLHKQAYHVMQVMNGINPGDPTYNTDQTLSNYKKTM